MARSLNGTSDMATADSAHVFGDATACSFAFWLKGAAAGTKVFYSEGINASTSQWSISSQTTSPTNKCRILFITGGTTRLDNTGSSVVLDNTWHHILVTLDTSRNWARYIDGVADGTGTYTTGTMSPDRLGIGVLRRNTNANFFPGTMAHIANWTRTLSSGEAKTLASGCSPLLLGPSHYWPFLGIDSPEPDLGIATHTNATLTGTSFAAGKDPPYLIYFDHGIQESPNFAGATDDLENTATLALSIDSSDDYHPTSGSVTSALSAEALAQTEFQSESVSISIDESITGGSNVIDDLETIQAASQSLSSESIADTERQSQAGAQSINLWDSLSQSQSGTPSFSEKISDSPENSATVSVSLDEANSFTIGTGKDILTGQWGPTLPLWNNFPIQSGNYPVNDTAEIQLNTGPNPLDTSSFAITLKCWKREIGTSKTLSLDIKLYTSSEDLVAERTISDVPTSPTLYNFPLTSMEVDVFAGDYSTPRFKLIADTS